MKVNLHRFFKHCTTLFVLTLLVTNCEKDIEIKNNPKQNNHSEQPQEINGITFLNVDTLLEDTDFQILQKNGVRVVKENNTHILITKEFSSPIYNDMIAKRYDGSKIIFSLTAVDNKNRFLDDNKQYDFTIDTALGIVYSNTQILTDLGIKNDNTAGKIAPVIRISYIYVTYEKSCDGTVNGVPQLHSYDNRSECSWNGSSKGPQRWTQVFVVSGSGLSTQGYNYNHYSDNNDDGPGGSSFVPFGGTPKIFVRNISKVGEAILVPYVLNFPQTVSDFIKEDPVFVSFLFKYLNYNGFTNDGIQVAHHWVQKYHDTSDMVYFDKIVELAKAAAADVHSLITFLELDDEQTYWIMDNAGVRNQLIAFAKANNTPQAKAFAVEAINISMVGGDVDVEEAYIYTNTPDDDYIFQGEKQNIPNPLILDNGTQISITFGTTKDLVNANQPVSVDLINGLKFSIEQANNNLSSSEQITSIYIMCTTNGHGTTGSSNHLKSTAVDISRINGQKMILSGVTNQIIELQKAMNNFQYIRENFGPYLKYKYSIESNSWNYNYPIGGHKDHIHFSVRK